MKPRQVAFVAALAAATLFTGCAAGGTASNPFSQDQTAREIKIYIDNRAFMDATIYAVTNGGRRRLGRVVGTRETVFTMPLQVPSELYLEVDLLAGPRCRTERILVDPGDQVEFTIQTDNPRWLCGAG